MRYAPFRNSGHRAYHGKYRFQTFTHNCCIATVSGLFEYLLSIRYAPYDMKHISKVAAEPRILRGERGRRTKVDRSTTTKVTMLLSTAAKWAAVIAFFATVDARLGGCQFY